LETSVDDIAFGSVTNVIFYAGDDIVFAWVGSSRGGGDARVNSASISIVADGRGVDVFATGQGLAIVAGAGVAVIAEVSGNGVVLADGSLVVGLVRPEARVDGARVQVVALAVQSTGRRRAMKVVGVDQTGHRVASIGEALVRSRNNDGGADATRGGVAGPLEAEIGLRGGGTSHIGVLASVLERIGGVFDADFGCAHVLVVALGRIGVGAGNASTFRSGNDGTRDAGKSETHGISRNGFEG